MKKTLIHKNEPRCQPSLNEIISLGAAPRHAEFHPSSTRLPDDEIRKAAARQGQMARLDAHKEWIKLL